MDSPIVAAFIRSALVPAAVVAAVLVALGFLREPLRTRLTGLVIALGFMYGGYQLLGRFNVPPHDVSESFGWAGLLLGLFVLWNPKSVGTRYLVRALVVLAAGAVVLWPLRATIANPAYHRNLIAFFCLGLGVWSITERMSGAVKLPTLLALPLISATGVSMLMLFSASASFSQLVSVLCAILGAILVLTLVMPKRIGRDALVPFVSLFVVLFMAAGHFQLDVNPWHMIYLSIPFAVLWIRDWLKFVPSHPIIEPLVLGLIAAAPVGYFVYNAAVRAGPLY